MNFSFPSSSVPPLQHNNTTDSDKSNIAISTHHPSPATKTPIDQLQTLPSHVFQGLFRFWFWLQRPELQRHKQRHKLPGRPHVPLYCILPYPDSTQGNHYCSRDYGSSAANSNSFHYSNSNGSYYYSNPNGVKAGPCDIARCADDRLTTGSTYYNSGTGYSNYTPPGGK